MVYMHDVMFSIFAESLPKYSLLLTYSLNQGSDQHLKVQVETE